MTDLFYNTTNETGTALKACKKAVSKQEKEVLAIFKALASVSPDALIVQYAPSEIHESFPNYPITSIRRAITNLTEAGYLRKTPVKIMSPWNRREHCWEIIK